MIGNGAVHQQVGSSMLMYCCGVYRKPRNVWMQDNPGHRDWTDQCCERGTGRCTGSLLIRKLIAHATRIACQMLPCINSYRWGAATALTGSVPCFVSSALGRGGQLGLFGLPLSGRLLWGAGSCRLLLLWLYNCPCVMTSTILRCIISSARLCAVTAMRDPTRMKCLSCISCGYFIAWQPACWRV